MGHRPLRPFLLTALLIALPILTGAGREGPTTYTIDIQGGRSEARRLAAEGARRFLGQGRKTCDLDSLLNSVASALLWQGLATGEIAVSRDSVGHAGTSRYRFRIDSLSPTRLDRWDWDPPHSAPLIESGPWTPEGGERMLQDLLRNVQDRGYPFASIQIVEAGESANGMTVRARIDPGPALTLSSVRFEGQGGTNRRFLERVTGLKRGEPIRPARAERARERLLRTGLFSEVMGPWLSVESAGVGLSSLVYRLTPAPQNRAEGAIGYDGQRRTLSGFVDLELGNLFGTGRRISAGWERLDRSRSRLSLDYREPYIAHLPVGAQAGVMQQIEDSTWSADEARITLDTDLGGGVSASSGLLARRTIFSRSTSSVRTRRVATILGLAYDGRSEAGTRGGRHALEVQRGRLRNTPQQSRAEGTLLKVSLAQELNFHLGRRGHLRIETAGGWIEGPDSLPRPETMGLGGAGGLRGYPEQAFRVLRFGLLRLEAGVRILPEGNRIYLFADNGMFRPWPAGAVKRRTSYGLGLRVRGGGGWVRLDYGVPSGVPPLSGRLHLRMETRF